MKVSQFKNIEEGFFSDIAQTVISRDDPEAREKKINAGAFKDFKRDFIKDFKADFEKYKSRIKITAPAVTESYSVFNYVLENAISEQPTSNRITLSQWILEWFKAYMQGVDWDKDKARVKIIAKEIEDNFSNTNQRNIAVDKLAQLAWNLVQNTNKIPYGAQNIGSIETSSSVGQQLIQQANKLNIENPNFKSDLATLVKKYNR